MSFKPSIQIISAKLPFAKKYRVTIYLTPYGKVHFRDNDKMKALKQAFDWVNKKPNSQALLLSS